MVAARVKTSATRSRAGKTKQSRSTHRTRTDASAAARDPRHHPQVQALEALMERERGRLMRVEALLGAAYIAFDSDEGDSHSTHIPTLIDLAYSLTRQAIAALESLHRLQVMTAATQQKQNEE